MSSDGYLNHSDTVDYVGVAKCASCHEDKHSTFIHTGMGLSFDSASKTKSSAKFGAEHIVFDSNTGFYYQPHWLDDDLYIKEFKLSGKDTIHQLNQKIDYIIGSGQHTNSHIFHSNKFLYQAPITFYIQEGKWDLAPGFENGNNSRFSRILNVECLSCHNAMPKMTEGSEYKFDQIGKGIDCERCHGPGELHVQLRESNKEVNGDDGTIVNPRKLTWERQIDLCQRCHLQGLNVLKEGKSFTDFKPGMKLNDVFEIYLPEYEGNNESFDMANHSARFQMSKCFVQGNKNELNFTCITCHNPHLSVKMTGTEVYNASCKKCHQKNDCTISDVEMQRTNSNCVSCHMPSNGSTDIPHVSVHDHFIRKPEKQDDVHQRKKLVGLYAVNNPSPDKRTQIKAYLEYWEKFDKNPFYINKAAQLLEGTNFNRLWLKYYYLKNDYHSATVIKINDNELSAWENMMLGVCYSKTKSSSQAIFYLSKAYKLDSTNPSIGKEYLKYLLSENKIERAYELASDLELSFPQDGIVANALARCNLLSGNTSSAKKYMNKAYELEPDNLVVWSTFLNYNAGIKNKQEFLKWYSRIIEKDPDYLDKNQIAAILDSMD